MRSSREGAFYVYENGSRTVIHRRSCGYCNDGKGISAGLYNVDHGRWHGGFETLDGAIAYATSLPRKPGPRWCRRCFPPDDTADADTRTPASA